MGAIAKAEGGLPFRRTDLYGSPRISEVMPMRKNGERTANLLAIIDAIATVICAVVSLLQLVRDIIIAKQKSNRQSKG